VASNQTPYSANSATTWMSYSGVAYCTLEGRHVDVESWTCDACKTLPYMNATVVHSTDANTCGYVGYDPANKFILVAFSGTDPLNIRNWIDDIDTIQVAYPYCTDCRVHQGFYDAYLSVQKAVWALVNQWLAVNPSAPIYTTGHSLGAALSMHAAIDIKINLKKTPAALYNFGQPRVGNKNFSDYYTTQIPTHWRVTHWKDPVPQLPPMSITKTGFYHQVQETWYNSGNTAYTLCNATNGEDPKCSDGQIDDNIADHLDYMNFDVTANYLTCKF